MLRWKAGALLVGAALTIVACGGGTAPTASGSAPASASKAPAAAGAASSVSPSAGSGSTSGKPTPVTLRLAWIPEGDAPPFALGKIKGFYKQEGLDVTIEPGKGSPVTAESVAQGHDTFGWVDTGSSITLISKGAPIKVIAVYQQQSPMSLIYLPPNKLDTPADLNGKDIYTAATSPEREMLPAVLAKGGLTMSDVHLQIFNPSEEASVLAKDPNGFVTGYDNADYPVIKAVSPNAEYRSYASFGVNIYNLGLVASLTEIKDHPGVVRRFVAASTKAWTYAVQHPNQASKDLVQLFPTETKLNAISSGFAVTKTLLYTPNSQGHPAGWMAPQDWQQSLQMMHQYGGVAQLKPADDYYTDQFIPQS